MRGPHITEVVLVCGGCGHWQVEVTRRALADLGAEGAMMAAAYAQAEHLDGDKPNSGDGDCVNPDGRVLVMGKWIERPPMANGQPTRGMMVAEPLPRWWVPR